MASRPKMGMGMVRSKTVHVVPTGGAWVVKREGREATVYSTKTAAVEHGRSIARDAAGQIVIHSRSGRIAEHVTYGLPKVQDPPRKSRLGKKRIEKAVSKVVMERLGSDPVPPRASHSQ